MNILIVSQYFFPENFKVNDLAYALSQRGHNVVVLTGKPNYPSGDYYKGYSLFGGPTTEKYLGTIVLRVPLLRRGKNSRRRMALNYLSFVVFASLLGPILLWGRKVDSIYCFGTSPVTQAIPAILIGFFKRAKVYFHVQDLWPDTILSLATFRSRSLNKSIGYLSKLIYRNCDCLMPTSPGFIKRLKLYAPGVPIFYLPQYAESFYKPIAVDTAERAAYGIPCVGDILTFAGNIGKAQGLENVLEALRIFYDTALDPQMHLVLVGDGSELENLKERSRTLRLSNVVHFVGPLPGDSVPRLFALSDFLLLPLREDPLFNETIPGKLQSYLACGKPILGSIGGISKRIIEENGLGLTAANESPAAIAEAMSILASLPPEDRQQLSRNARDYFLATFEREELLDRTEKLLRGETVLDN